MKRQMMWITLIIFGFCLGSCSKFPHRMYYYVDMSATWFEAQQYCREHYTDLATFEIIEDVNRLEAPFSYSWAWIGFWDDPNSWKNEMGNESNSWRWSATGETSKTGYKAWSSGNPDFWLAKETCVVMLDDGTWSDVMCDLKRNFTCYNVTEQNVKQYVYISALKTWGSAQSYCRTHYTDLVKIDSEAENLEVKKIIPAHENVWIGLYRVPWLWSDKTPNSFRNQGSVDLNNNKNQHCVLDTPSHLWFDSSCSVKSVFICHQVVRMTTTVKIATVTDADLTDPAINAQVLQQLGALLTRQGWTDFQIRWKIEPKKKDKIECTELQCNTLA